MKKCCLIREKDRLSYLPDSIRGHIVSFLPMKDAIRTSILSRRWENVCSSLSNMEFDKETFKWTGNKVAHFRNSVDRLLFCHDGSDITRLSLKTDVDAVFITSSHVNAWISFALQHNVKHLVLSKCSENFLKFPRSFYTCSSLTVLSLVSICLIFPSFVHFPMLKSFHLKNVRFYGENLINKLVSSCTCPMLEELEIDFCVLDDIKSLSISNPGLKNLKLLVSNGNAVNVSVPNLRKLDCYSSCRAPTISCETLMSLVSADFYFLCSLQDETAKDFLIINRKILKGLPNVQKLRLYDNFIEFLCRDQDLAAHLPSSCPSLKQLRLAMFPTNANSQVVRLLLRGFTNLQSLCVYVGNPTEEAPHLNINETEEYLEFKELPAATILSCLRTVEIKYFKGSDGELDLLRYLIQNAKHLEKINILKSYALQDSDEIQLSTSIMLSTLTRVAPNLAKEKVAINWIEL